MKAKKAKSDKIMFDADLLMKKISAALTRDFQTGLNDPSFCSDHLVCVEKGDIREIRESVPALNMEDEDAYRFKCTYQIASLFKRYRFETDLFSDSELKELSISKFLSVQDHLSSIPIEQVFQQYEKLLDRAARYIANTLGDFDDEECRSLSRFGKRASVGIPARKACEAARWEIPISGSQQQIDWFDSEMSQNCRVQEYWAMQEDSDPNRSIYQSTSCLVLALVPKTFKSFRTILANTTLGSYQSLGIGEMIRQRLKRRRFDIRKLQFKHRNLAKRSSVTGFFVTMDLSSASDCIYRALVERLFPPDWFKVMDQNRIETIVLPDGNRIESKTFCTMGIGYTFPLQTLLFLALLKAIEKTYCKGRPNLISVYGDDMIYHVSLHEHVMRVFSALGFMINVEKTFSSGHFRESCGGDYFRGVDVRPFQPRNGHSRLSPRAYEAMLYKCINGLLMRWSEYDIPRTLQLLCSELKTVVQGIKVVPEDYPDEAGVKCPSLSGWDFLQSEPCLSPKHIGHGLFRFIYLQFKPKIVEENRHEPYYWASLRGVISTDIYSSDDAARVVGCNIRDRIDKVTGVNSNKEPLLIKRIIKGKTFRAQCGRRLKRTQTYVTLSHTGSYIRQTGISGFENRR